MLDAKEMNQMEQEGAVHVFTLSEPMDDRQAIYGVSFAPYAAGGGSIRIDKRVGLARLEEQLRAIGILDEFREPALEEVRSTGRTHIARLCLVASSNSWK